MRSVGCLKGVNRKEISNVEYLLDGSREINLLAMLLSRGGWEEHGRNK